MPTVQNDASNTNANQITIKWADPASTGGTPVIDYAVQMATGTGTYTQVVAGLKLNTYTAYGVTTGSYYKFKVKAQNKVDYGDASVEVSILAAQVPDKPTTPTTVFISDSIIISWTPPENRGSDILGYHVLIKKFDGTYIQDFVHCDGKTFSPTGVSFCTMPSTVLNSAPYNLVWGS